MVELLDGRFSLRINVPLLRCYWKYALKKPRLHPGIVGWLKWHGIEFGVSFPSRALQLARHRAEVACVVLALQLTVGQLHRLLGQLATLVRQFYFAQGAPQIHNHVRHGLLKLSLQLRKP